MTGTGETGSGGPFDERRRIYDLLSQETRHLILQFVLAHPAHLPSLDELAYLIPKNKAAIRDQLEVLRDAGIVEWYDHPPNEGSRDLPSQFYGLTEHGVEVLHEYSYLDGLPVARAIYDNTRLSEKARRHRDAPRPELPPAVDRALAIDGHDGDFDRVERFVRERMSNARSVDDQVEVAKAFYEAGIGPDHEGIKRPDLADRIDLDVEYDLRTVLRHLVDVGLVEEVSPPGPDVFAISERSDEIVTGRATEAAEECIEALVAHVDDELQSVELERDGDESEAVTSTPSVALADGAGRTVRSILASSFGVAPERVVEHLRSGDPVERLNRAVDAIESSEEVSESEDDGRIAFVRPAYRYRLAERAMDLLDDGRG